MSYSWPGARLSALSLPSLCGPPDSVLLESTLSSLTFSFFSSGDAVQVALVLNYIPSSVYLFSNERKGRMSR